MNVLTSSEFDGLLPEQKFDRRNFLVTSLAAGFALAVQPVSAQTITTDSNGLVAGEIKIPVKDGEIPGYRAMPASGGPFGTVLVVQEIFGGARAHSRLVSPLRQAELLCHCAGALRTAGRRVEDIQRAGDRRQRRQESAGCAGHGRPRRRGCVRQGFRQGGYFALRHHGILLGRADRVDVRRAQSGSEGRGCVVRAARPFILSRRQERSRRGEGPEAPVLGLYGGADQGIPVDTVNKMRDALRAAKKPGDLIVYPDTPHGFNADYRPSYRKEAADDGWKRLQSWFAVYGVV